MSAVLFYGFAILSIVGALGVIAAERNSTLAALAFTGSMFALGALYVLLDAVFVAAIQVLFCAGALGVLFSVVATTLQPRRDRMRPTQGMGVRVAAIVGGALIAVNGAALLAGGSGAAAALPEGFGGHRALGLALLTDRLLAFEFVSLLLLIAVVGVVLLVHREAD